MRGRVLPPLGTDDARSEEKRRSPSAIEMGKRYAARVNPFKRKNREPKRARSFMRGGRSLAKKGSVKAKSTKVRRKKPKKV